MVDRNELWSQAFELGQMIADSPEVARYKVAQQVMESSANAKPLLNKLRDVQEQYDKLAEHGTGAHLRPLEDDINGLLDKLDQFDEVREFKEASKEVDQLLRSVTQLLAATVTNKVSDEPMPLPQLPNQD